MHPVVTSQVVTPVVALAIFRVVLSPPMDPGNPREETEGRGGADVEERPKGLDGDGDEDKDEDPQGRVGGGGRASRGRGCSRYHVATMVNPERRTSRCSRTKM